MKDRKNGDVYIEFVHCKYFFYTLNQFKLSSTYHVFNACFFCRLVYCMNEHFSTFFQMNSLLSAIFSNLLLLIQSNYVGNYFQNTRTKCTELFEFQIEVSFLKCVLFAERCRTHVNTLCCDLIRAIYTQRYRMYI